MQNYVGSISFMQIALQLIAIIILLIIHTMAHLYLIDAIWFYCVPVNPRRISIRSLSYSDTRHGQGESYRVRRVASEPTGSDQGGDHSSKYALMHSDKVCPFLVFLELW